MAGSHTDEPRPRVEPLVRSAFAPATLDTEWLAPPPHRGPRDFVDVLRARRSRLAGSVGRHLIAELLWHGAGTKGFGATGRAGIPLQWRATPSAGGLHPIHLVCIDDGPDTRPRLYDPVAHAYHVLDVDCAKVTGANAAAVTAVIGAHRGCTIRMVADYGKVDAAYEQPSSLVMRDAGCLLATLCLCAEWLGLAACPLGFLGGDLISWLGFPEPRFRALGGLQVTR